MGNKVTKRVILHNHQSPGDILMLTILLRDWKKAYPEDLIRVNTSTDVFFENNPNVEKKELAPKVFDTNALNVEDRYDVSDNGWLKIMAHYSDETQFNRLVNNPYSIHKCGEHRKHFAYAMIGYVNSLLNLNIKLTSLKPDLYLTDEEKEPFEETPDKYWVVVPGGKQDYLRKIWSKNNWDKLFDMFSNTNFVQIGGKEEDHIKPRFKKPNVINLSGRTSLREALSLIYNSQGVISPITFAMHAAAAFDKQCIVIAGGGEHHTWEAYSKEAGAKVPHNYLHTCGMLPCCKNGGCWTGDCENKASDGEQKCMKMITPEIVGNVLAGCL